MYALDYDSVAYYFNNCSGLLLTGGADIEPDKYGKGEEIDRCGSLDLKRDSIEILLIELAKQKNLPILGVCRGEQILNVASGGSLIIDLPTDVGTEVTHRIKGKKAFHDVRLDSTSVLYEITQADTGRVISNHHQAVDVVAPHFVVAARSADGVVEAIEYENIKEHFMVGVQWHPEVMLDSQPLSGKIGNAIVKRIFDYYYSSK